MSSTLWVEPQLGTISGGLRYNQQIRAALEAMGIRTHVLSLPPGSSHGEDSSAAIRDAVEKFRPEMVIVDGLIGSAQPQLFTSQEDDGGQAAADVLLVHLPAGAALEAQGLVDSAVVAREQQAVESAHHVVTVSRWGAAQLRRRYRRRDIHVAVPGVDVPRSLPPRAGTTGVTFVCVAALNSLKNHRLLADALEPLQDHDWSLVLVGPGAETDYGAQVLTDFDERLAARVDYRGVLDPAQVFQLWAGADLLLLPSLVETYGMVVTEACAHGVPAFVTAATGAQEALGGAGAALAAEPGQWTAALEKFLTEEAFRDRLRRSASRRRNNLPSWEGAAEIFCRLR